MSAPVSAPASSPAAPAPGVRPRLLLLDGHSLAYRAFFALPVENFSTTTGQPTNAVYGFTSMLINVLRDEQPSHLAVAFDVGRKTFRSEIYAEYKANRSESPTDFRGQVSLIQEVLGALHVPVITAEGYRITDFNGDPDVDFRDFHIDWDLSAAEKGGYEYFMLKEIAEQPCAVSDTLLGHFADNRILLDEQRPIRIRRAVVPRRSVSAPR